jgi:formylglycine-generating enzyme required for sulfatase activity
MMTSTVDGMVLVYVPEGEFYMGSSGNDPQAATNEQPQRLVSVSAFWIDQTEVTNAQYEKCVSAGVCTEPTSSRYVDPRYGNYPVVTVTWFQAAEYCAWVGGRLPTEAEWEKAARGPAATGGRRIWPWGNNTPGSTLANFNNNEGNTVAVGSYPRGASLYGALDMAGNAWEWVADYYAEDYYQTASAAGLNADPTGPDKGFWRITRGGGYISAAQYIRLAIRADTAPDRRAGYIGFRCVRPMTPGTTKPLPTPQP